MTWRAASLANALARLAKPFDGLGTTSWVPEDDMFETGDFIGDGRHVGRS